MSKRPRSGSAANSTAVDVPTNKKSRLVSTPSFNPNKVATAENAAAVVSDPPLPILLKAVQDAINNPKTGQSIVYWMRMADLRSSYWCQIEYIAYD
jgi:deoxyribodipyrimidine photo-lyase